MFLQWPGRDSTGYLQISGWHQLNVSQVTRPEQQCLFSDTRVTSIKCFPSEQALTALVIFRYRDAINLIFPQSLRDSTDYLQLNVSPVTRPWQHWLYLDNRVTSIKCFPSDQVFDSTGYLQVPGWHQWKVSPVTRPGQHWLYLYTRVTSN